MRRGGERGVTGALSGEVMRWAKLGHSSDVYEWGPRPHRHVHEVCRQDLSSTLPVVCSCTTLELACTGCAHHWVQTLHCEVRVPEHEVAVVQPPLTRFTSQVLVHGSQLAVHS